MKYYCMMYYYLGHWVSIPMFKYDWAFLYPLYHYLISKSVDISDKYNLDIWK